MNRNMKPVQNPYTYGIRVIELVAKEMRSAKFYAILMISIMLTVIFTLSPAILSLMNSVIIPATGRITTENVIVTANSGSAEDIQAAVDTVAAVGGGTVYIPAGDWGFDLYGSYTASVHVSGGINIIGAGKDEATGTVLRVNEFPDQQWEFTTMFELDGSNGKPIRISGIQFIGYVDYSKPSGDAPGQAEWSATFGVTSYSVTDLRIDNCYFQDFTCAAIASNGDKGVIDHCDIIQEYHYHIPTGDWNKWGYGIIVSGVTRQPLNNVLGKYDELDYVVYIEDCYFEKCRHCTATAVNTPAHQVIRYCTLVDLCFESNSYVDAHGGALCTEMYNNDVSGTGNGGIGIGVGLRGGGGVIFNNNFKDLTTGVYLNDEGYADTVWIWDNNYNNVGSTLSPGGWGEYFLTSKPDYVPYVYPHPLTQEAPP